MVTSIAHPTPQLGDTVAERWTLARLIGRGGTGVVYEAVDRVHGRNVAVKVLFAPLKRDDGNARERGASEPIPHDLPKSRHIVAVDTSGVDQASGAHYLVMPLLEGQDLRTLLHQFGPLQPAVAARVVRQACAGLIEAHAAGVVHGDLKPSNLFLDYDPNGGVLVRLLDFDGAPNARAGADASSDVFGLGITLYAALSGASPFAKVGDGEPGMPLQDQAPWLDPSLAAVVHGCLVAEPLHRCPSADALARALEPYTGGTDALDYRMLAPLTTAQRAARPAREEVPTRWLGTVTPTQAVDVTLSVKDSLAGATIAERYSLRRRLGAGGMGWVYEAVGELGVRVAVKVIHAKEVADNETRKRFVREARTAAAVSSPHVVRVIDAGEDSKRGLPFLVMELLCGQDLSALVREVGPLEPQTAARIFVQACRGLAAAHAAGLVHRDVKPGNLFLHQLPSGEVIVKLCDFGIAKQIACDGEDGATQEILTRSDSILGSPAYMSPEQIKRSMTLDPRADVWSLGASLYHALVGTPPWTGCGEVGEVMFAIFTQDIEPRTEKTPWLPRKLAQVVERAMCRSLTNRFQSIDEIEQALLPFTGGSTTVHAADLVGVPESKRNAPANDADDAINTIDGSPATLQARSGAMLIPVPRRRVGITLAVAAAFVVLLAIAMRSGAPLVDGVPKNSERAATAPGPTAALELPSAEGLASATGAPDSTASAARGQGAIDHDAAPGATASASPATIAARTKAPPTPHATALPKAAPAGAHTGAPAVAPAGPRQVPSARPTGFAPAPFQ